MVDLAGPENVKSTAAAGWGLKIASSVNTSLSVLNEVIYKLTGKKSAHIPYRADQLTRLLQNSLGGNTKTVLLSHIPTVEYYHDVIITALRQLNRAKGIKNRPTQSIFSDSDTIQDFRSQMDDSEELQKSEYFSQLGDEDQNEERKEIISEAEDIQQNEEVQKSLEENEEDQKKSEIESVLKKVESEHKV